MNKKVIKKMMKFKITVHHVLSTSSLGDKTSEIFDVMGYFQEDIKLVLNRLGRQETSSSQVYLTGVDILKIEAEDRIDISVPVKKPKDNAPEKPEDPEIPEESEDEQIEGLSEDTESGDVEDPEEESKEESEEPETDDKPEESEVEYKLIWKDRPIIKMEVYYKPNAEADVGVLYLP